MPLFPLGRRLFRRSLPVALLTTGFAASGAVSLALVVAVPARALERVELLLPLLDTSFSINLAEVASDRSPMAGDSDLAQLDQALDGVISRKLREVFLQPLPVQNQRMANQVAHSAMLNQALLAASALGQVQGFPAQTDPGTELALVVQRASAKGELSLLALLQAIPGESVTVDLDRALALLRRLKTQQQLAAQLITSSTPVAVNPKQAATGPLQLRRSTRSIVVPHRSEALELVIYSPDGQSGPQAQQRQLVVISHGLWDAPESFEGWARHLASHGYTVVLPLHPGSDRDQQRAMLSGEAKPPSPEELRLRPLDVKAILDGFTGADTQNAVVIGHSWGATTALQLAGLKPSSSRLHQSCNDSKDPSRNRNDPDRNMSWVLQCSFLSSADRSNVADPRVIAVAAVSPPLFLLFDQGSSAGMSARTLLVTGSRDWVVPAGPEAIAPFSRSRPAGHQLVVAGGGDHFNLRGPATGDGGPLRGLLLGWVNGAYAAGPNVRPAPGAPPLLPADGWGDADKPLVDATTSVLPLQR